jgi:hypothetical protein
MAFELYATGQYTLVRLRELLNAKGLRSVKNRTMTAFRYQYLLQNPFYYGVFVLNGEMHQGAHEPLVTKDLFDKVQEVMTRRSKPNSVRLKSYVYRGLLHCGECGCGVTMETQKGHNYLRCTKRVKKDCSQPYVREENMTTQIAAALTSVSLPDDTADRLVQRLETLGIMVAMATKKVAKTAAAAKSRVKPGPKAEVLKLEGDWRENIRKSFQAVKPAKGWPKS